MLVNTERKWARELVITAVEFWGEKVTQKAEFLIEQPREKSCLNTSSSLHLGVSLPSIL